MTRLTLVPTPEQRRAAFARAVAGLELPPALDGQEIYWPAWEPRLRMTHIDPACEHCGDRDGAITHGTVPFRPRRSRRPPWDVIRYLAWGCPACRAVDVVDLYPGGLHAGEFDPVLVWANTGQQSLF